MGFSVRTRHYSTVDTMRDSDLQEARGVRSTDCELSQYLKASTKIVSRAKATIAECCVTSDKTTLEIL
jgi:hypothetical protein